VQITPDIQLAACSADPAATYRAAPGAVGALMIVVADDDVDEILGSDSWLVVQPSAPDPRAQALLAKTARFSEGRDHLARRAAAQAFMPDPARAPETARLLSGKAIADAGRFLDAMPVAWHVPVATLASCLGIPQDPATGRRRWSGGSATRPPRASFPAGPPAASGKSPTSWRRSQLLRAGRPPPARLPSG
jgi:cytochrome P450